MSSYLLFVYLDPVYLHQSFKASVTLFLIFYLNALRPPDEYYLSH